MVGVFAAATARLTPHFVESFDPEKLAAKFVRVEKEFGVKFTKSNTTFNIVGHWEAVRKAHKSLLKLKFNEKETKTDKICKRKEETGEEKLNEVCAGDTVENLTTEIFNDEEVVHTPDQEPTPEKEPPLLRGKGNPKRGRQTAKKSPYSSVPEPVFFLQYQDKTFSDVVSLNIDSVLEDFEKSEHSNKVTKDELKKILEKNKDQMGKPLENGIPKGAILPVPKVTEQSSDTFVVEDMLNPIPKSAPMSSVSSSGLSEMPLIATNQSSNYSYSYLSSGQILFSSSNSTGAEVTNSFNSSMTSTYAVDAKMTAQVPGMSTCNNHVNNQDTVGHVNISDFYNHSEIQTGRLATGVFSDNQCSNNEQLQLSESDTDSFSSMFENYDPQAMLNTIPPSEITFNTPEGSAVINDAAVQGENVSVDVPNNTKRIFYTQDETRSDFQSKDNVQCNTNRFKANSNGFGERDSSAFDDFTELPADPQDFAAKDFTITMLQSRETDSSTAVAANVGSVSMVTSVSQTAIATPTLVSSDILTNKPSTLVSNVTEGKSKPDEFFNMPTGQEFMESVQVTMATNIQTTSTTDVLSPGPASSSDAAHDIADMSEKEKDTSKLSDKIISQVEDIAISTDNQTEAEIVDEANAINEAAENENKLVDKDEKDTEQLEKYFVKIKTVHKGQVTKQSGGNNEKAQKKGGVQSKTGSQKKQEKVKKTKLPAKKVKEKSKEKEEKIKPKKVRKAKPSDIENKQKNANSASKETCDEDVTVKESAENATQEESSEKPKDRKKIVNRSNKDKSQKKVKQKVEKKEDTSVEESKEKQIFKCTECDYQGYRKKRLSEHMGRVHGLLVNGNQPENPMFACDECEKKFVFEKDLSRHKKIVHHGQVFVCLVCNKSYKSKYVYDRHTATHAEGYVQPKFKCQICEQEFTTKFSLSSHIKSKHLGVKKTYSCPTCGKTFSQIRSYRQHANVHAGIRPYTCEICGKSFTYDKSLKEHRYMHDTVRRFQCTICQKAFRQQTCLLIHMKVHKEKKDHICSVCGREFTQKQSLLRHERIHTGDKPYSCKICYKSFGDYAVIRKHVMMAHKINKDAWKQHAMTIENKRSSHYIDGGPGYVPRESYAKINQTDITTVIPPPVLMEKVNHFPVSQAPAETNHPSLLNFVDTTGSTNHSGPSGSDISATDHNNTIALQEIYRMSSFPDSLEFNVMDSQKLKHENALSQIGQFSSQNLETDTYGILSSPQHNLNSKPCLTSLVANPLIKVAESSDDAYTSQFLNSLDLASNMVMEKPPCVISAVANSSSAGVSVATTDTLVSGSLVSMATTNNTWMYPSYSSAYFSPSSFSPYQSPPDT